MEIKSTICYLGFISTLIFSSTSFADGKIKNPASNRQEALMGVSVDQAGITFQVASNGCTVKSDFEVKIKETWPMRVELLRNVLDECEDSFLRYGTSITFTYSEVGLKQDSEFVITNPLSTVHVY